MSASNPFQIPACLQQADFQQRRQKRFKKTVIAIIAGFVLMLIGLLIEGCKSERAAGAAGITPLGDVPAAAEAQTAVTTPVESKPEQDPQPAMSQSTPTVPKLNAPTAAHLETVYVVKTGDTLTHIARAHGTTVKAIEAANGLVSDRIAVGVKLKMPEA
jgi:LysM repeat protein